MTTSHHVPSVQAGSLRPRPDSDGQDHYTSRPLRSGRVPAPAAAPRPDDGPDHHIITSPPFRPGPCARALTRMTRTSQPSPPDPVGPTYPTRTPPGSWGPPGARPVISPASRPGHRGPDTISTVGLVPGCATPPQRQLWTCWIQHPTGAGTFHAGATVTERTSWGLLLRVRLPQPDSGTSSTPTRTRGLRANPWEPLRRRAYAKVGRVYPSHPAALRQGM